MNKAEIYAKLLSHDGELVGLTSSDVEAACYLRDQYHRFLLFSVAVTAFKKVELQGTGQAEAFLVTIIKIVGWEILEQVLDTFDVYKGSPKELRQHLFGDEKLGPVVRSVIKLWFSGVWYQLPKAWSQKYGPIPNDVTHMVSPEAYVEGLMWPTIGAHPAGAKAPGYGSWALRPVIPTF